MIKKIVKDFVPLTVFCILFPYIRTLADNQRELGSWLWQQSQSVNILKSHVSDLKDHVSESY